MEGGEKNKIIKNSIAKIYWFKGKYAFEKLVKSFPSLKKKSPQL